MRAPPFPYNSNGLGGFGGAGGGGYYGGGSGGGGAALSDPVVGAGGGGGGGGSSYATPTASAVTFNNGVNRGDGAVVIQYQVAPAITSAASTTFSVTRAGSFTVTSTGVPDAEFTATGALPEGVTLSQTGVLSGTPKSGTVGTYPLTITADNGVAPAAVQGFTLEVAKATQDIAFTSSPPVASAGTTTYVPSATATSGLPVSFSVDPDSSSVCAIDDGEVSFVAAGTCLLQADQPGNADYLPAESVTQSIPVGHSASMISVSGPAQVTVGEPAEFLVTRAALPVPLLARVHARPSAGTGTVSFMLGSTKLGEVPMDDTGHARFVTSALPVGTQTIQVSYDGDAAWTGSSATWEVRVVAAAQPADQETTHKSTEKQTKKEGAGLPVTGFAPIGLLGGACLLLAGGAIALTASRRRRS